jgi:2-polyprenyl-3-methyl-5-hydroxy-6-metoxy-1,4-benzoquinol methylase
MKDTSDLAYKTRLVSSDAKWKRILDVQRPYRWNLKRLGIKNVLDVGCGIGRNLRNLSKIGVSAVGVDHNKYSVAEANDRGFKAFTVEDFRQHYSSMPSTFDSILISHVLEHMAEQEAVTVLKEYLPYLKPEGQIVVITPQEAGYKTDSTHTNFVTLEIAQQMMGQAGVKYQHGYSFPFPGWVGKFFPYNEFVAVGRK